MPTYWGIMPITTQIERQAERSPSAPTWKEKIRMEFVGLIRRRINNASPLVSPLCFPPNSNKLYGGNLSFLFGLFPPYRSYGKENNNNENEWILLCLENHRRQGKSGYYSFLILALIISSPCKLVSIMHDGPYLLSQKHYYSNDSHNF